MITLFKQQVFEMVPRIARTLTLDVLSGRASRDYVCGLERGDAIPTCEKLSNLFGYFKAMRTCHAKLRYFDWDGQFQEAQAIAYADDGYIKGKLTQAAFDVAQNILQASPSLAHLSNDILLASFCPEGFIGIGVPIGTDVFVRNFVAKPCKAIIDDVDKLDAIQDGFIHYQLIRFCQATRLQHLNSHILLGNRCVLQQQHVECK
jgi:hypothetical protein